MPSSAKSTQRVVVVGAGPAGLLAAIFLLGRNRRSNGGGDRPKYLVTLIDPGLDYGRLDDNELGRFRSWMIGLSAHGLAAVKQVPDLYEEYLEKLGINIVAATIGIGRKIQFDPSLKDFEGFTVDRNFICAALARYLNEKFGNEKIGRESVLTTHYNTKALFVDGDNRNVLVRRVDKQNDMKAVPYDLLLGCDGIRSVVRNAFMNAHRDFEFDLKGTFGNGKSVHIPLPKDVGEGRFMLLINCLPNCTAFCLPETGGKLNFACGHASNRPCHEALNSDDPKVVSDYFRENFTSFSIDYEEMGKQWVSQAWSSTGQVHCNFYHSERLSAIIMGDAAHATSPQIGQGMNTALADAAAMNELLDLYDDDLDKVLPAFSRDRVKEGNALTDLSFHTFCISAPVQMMIVARQGLRRWLNGIFPAWLVTPEPMLQVPKGMKLSVAYNEMQKLGYMKYVRRVNNEIMQEYFEKKTGMVRETPTPTYAKEMWQVLQVFLVVWIFFVFLIFYGRTIPCRHPEDAACEEGWLNWCNRTHSEICPERFLIQ